MNRYGFIQRITITPDMKDPVSGQRVFFWIFSYWSAEQAVCQGWGYSYLKNVRWRFRLTPNRQSVKGGGIHTWRMWGEDSGLLSEY